MMVFSLALVGLHRVFQGGVLDLNAVLPCNIQTMIGPSLFKEKSVSSGTGSVGYFTRDLETAGDRCYFLFYQVELSPPEKSDRLSPEFHTCPLLPSIILR